MGHLTTFIYGLIDPRNGYIRYVGKSNNPSLRLKFHLQPSQLRNPSHKVHWLRELINEGKRPIVVTIEEVPYASWKDAEKKWISYYRNIPNYPPLTNSTDGGDGIEGFVFTEEMRKRQSMRMTGITMPPGTGKKISAANKGKEKSKDHRKHLSEGQRNRWANSSLSERAKMLANLRTPWTEEKRIHRSNCAMNVPKKIGASSIYKGVCFAKSQRGTKKWQASCQINGKTKFIGMFSNEEDAARARDLFMLAHIGERAPLNFPRSDYA